MSIFYGQPKKGLDPLGILGSVLSLVPGAQPFGMGLSALNSAIKGDTVGAVMAGAKAAGGIGGTSGGQGAADQASNPWDDLYKNSVATSPQPTADPFAYKPQYQGSVQPTPINTGLSNANTGGLVKDQAFYDNKYKTLGQMYGLPGDTGFHADVARDYYKDYGAGGQFDTDDDQGIFNALMRQFGK